MKHTGFRYDVHVELEFSGQELMILRELSRTHYDSWCKSISEHGGFLYGWINRFIMVIDYEDKSKDPDWKPADYDGGDPDEFLKKHADRVVRLTVSSDELDTINKVLEGLEFWLISKTEEEKKIPSGLWWNCKQAFKALQEDWKRVNEEEKRVVG